MLDTIFQVVVDFLLAWIHTSPFRGRSEGKRIEVRRNIASAAGITIVPPGAANVRTLFDDEKRVHTGFEKLDARAQAGEAGTHDQDVDIPDDGTCGIGSGFSHARAITS